jgi:hypothetical protein
MSFAKTAATTLLDVEIRTKIAAEADALEAADAVEADEIAAKKRRRIIAALATVAGLGALGAGAYFARPAVERAAAAVGEKADTKHPGYTGPAAALKSVTDSVTKTTNQPGTALGVTAGVEGVAKTLRSLAPSVRNILGKTEAGRVPGAGIVGDLTRETVGRLVGSPTVQHPTSATLATHLEDQLNHGEGGLRAKVDTPQEGAIRALGSRAGTFGILPKPDTAPVNDTAARQALVHALKTHGGTVKDLASQLGVRRAGGVPIPKGQDFLQRAGIHGAAAQAAAADNMRPLLKTIAEPTVADRFNAPYLGRAALPFLARQAIGHGVANAMGAYEAPQ